MMGKAHHQGTFPKCKVELNYNLVLGLFFGNAPAWGLPYTKTNSWIYAYTYIQQDLKHE